MRVGFDAKRLFFNTRGLGNYSRDTLRLLSTYYADSLYRLYTPKSPTTQYPFLKGNRAVSVATPASMWGRLLPSLWRISSICSQLAKDDLDIYHGLSNELPWGIDRVGVKTIVTIHDLIPFRHPELYDRLYVSIVKAKFRYAARVADRIIAISEQTKADIVSFLQVDPAKIEVVYQGCSPLFHQDYSAGQIEAIKDKYQLPKEYILTVGAIEKRKNQLSLIQALAHSKHEISLVIVGGRSRYMQELESYVAAHQSGSSVMFLSNISHPELPLIYRGAKLFAYPSLFEGFGIPLVEALFSDIPIITTQGGCFSEAAGQAALYINPLDPTAIAAAIDQILGDTALCQKLLANGKIQRERFADSQVAASLMSCYRRFIVR